MEEKKERRHSHFFGMLDLHWKNGGYYTRTPKARWQSATSWKINEWKMTKLVKINTRSLNATAFGADKYIWNTKTKVCSRRRNVVINLQIWYLRYKRRRRRRVRCTDEQAMWYYFPNETRFVISDVRESGTKFAWAWTGVWGIICHQTIHHAE